MSRSRFVLKQLPVRGQGASDLTRYVARSKLDTHREGPAARPLFTADADHLTVAAARRWLSIVGDTWDKEDALHYVLSFASDREYELLGDDEKERRRVVADLLRASLRESWPVAGLAEVRWVAGVHRNTDNPHLHLLLNRQALRSDAETLTRLGRLPVPLIAHHTHQPDGTRRFEYGAIITALAAHTDAHHRARARVLQYESPLGAVRLTRSLLALETLQQRAPNAAEQLAGAWLLAEIAAGLPHTQRGHDDLRTTLATPTAPNGAIVPGAATVPNLDLPALRSQMARLDQLAALQGQPPTAAFLPTPALRALLLTPPAGAQLTLSTSLPPVKAHDLPSLMPTRTAAPRAALRPDPPLILPTPSPHR